MPQSPFSMARERSQRWLIEETTSLTNRFDRLLAASSGYKRINSSVVLARGLGTMYTMPGPLCDDDDAKLKRNGFLDSSPIKPTPQILPSTNSSSSSSHPEKRTKVQSSPNSIKKTQHNNNRRASRRLKSSTNSVESYDAEFEELCRRNLSEPQGAVPKKLQTNETHFLCQSSPVINNSSRNLPPGAPKIGRKRFHREAKDTDKKNMPIISHVMHSYSYTGDGLLQRTTTKSDSQ